MTKLISIIVPTTRPGNKTLESFFRFNIPEHYDLEYLFIIDEPSKNTENLNETIKKYPQFKVEVIKNNKNLGASASRNIGLRKSKGDFILSLDDDCVLMPDLIEKYVQAYEAEPDYPGYIGLTSAPEPKSSFDKAIGLSDMRHFFEIAKHKKEFYWGITANLFLKRESIEGICFSLDHPKKGGGEDIAFCLEILKKNNSQEKKIFKCVPEAEVEHPFWEENLDGYKRFFRWGNGDIVLHKKFPEYKYHQFPNLIEFLFLSVIINIILFVWIFPFTLDFLSFLLALITIFLTVLFLIFTWEVLCESRKLKRREVNHSMIPLIKAVVIRQLNDLGRFLRHLREIWNITSRWDYFCTGESLKYETKVAARKFFGFLIIYIVIILIGVQILIK